MIARVRSEIEQMEGARKRLTTRIDFATSSCASRSGTLEAAALAWPLWALWRRRLRAQVFLRKS